MRSFYFLCSQFFFFEPWWNCTRSQIVKRRRVDESSKGRRGIGSPGRFNKISLSYRLPSFKEYRSDELPDNRTGRKPWQIFIPTIAHVIANITIPACLTGYSALERIVQSIFAYYTRLTYCWSLCFAAFIARDQHCSCIRERIAICNPREYNGPIMVESRIAKV